MAVNKKLIITFSELVDPIQNQFIEFVVSNGATEYTFRETFRTVRQNNFQVTIANPQISIIPQQNAINLNEAINLDGSNSLYNIQSRIDAIAATLTVEFSEEFLYFVSVSGSLIDLGVVSTAFEQGTQQDEKTVFIDSYKQGSPNTCEDIITTLLVTGGNNTYNVYVDNVLSLSNQTSPIDVPLKRGQTNSLRVTDGLDFLIDTVTSINPRRLITSDITTQVTNLSAGSNITVTATYISPYVSDYSYSLDGVNFTSVNVFTSLTSSTYTVYVKDSLGCVTSKQVVIDGVTTVTETIFSISEVNPIRYMKYEPNVKMNYKNTLSCNSLRTTSFKYYQKFLANDSPTTQFKTNAQYINVYALDSELNTTQLSPSKRTENIGLTAKSTCTYFDLGDGKSGVYFGVVDLLNPLNDEVIGNQNFGFALPTWANVAGNYVNIEGIGEVQIDDIVFNDFYQAFILEFNINYIGSAVERKILSNYNKQPYEIYEFLTEMALLPEKFNIVIEVGVDGNNIDFTYISETVKRVDDEKFLFEIDYWDDENRGGLVYQTGVKNKLRVYGRVDYLGNQTTEGYDGDQKYYVTDNTVYNSETFKFIRLSYQMAQKLRLVVTHKYLYINGISYDLAEEPEVTGDENTNLKTFSVSLKTNGDLLLESVSEDIVGTTESLEITAGLTAIKNKALLLWTKNL
jgi:hypothetical protein